MAAGLSQDARRAAPGGAQSSQEGCLSPEQVTATTLAEALAIATSAAREAQVVLLLECHGGSGPRGPRGHCPADDAAELVIRQRLLKAFPDWGFLGEETGAVPARQADGPTWVVDPNDGTEPMQEGYRGHAVSIALIHQRLPVLGVVLAVDAPDDEGDLITWAEGCGPVGRNGRAVEPEPWPQQLRAEDVVILSHGADRHPAGNLAAIQPARFRAMPSLAYRLALVATREGVATVSLHRVSAWDYAAGHALIRGAGGDVVDGRGDPVRYAGDGSSSSLMVCAGSPTIVRELVARDWSGVAGSGFGLAASTSALSPVHPQPGRLAHGMARLRRAQGCLLGQVAGDALGALVEFSSADSIARQYPDGGPRLLADGGPHGIQAGQPTDDSEMALLLARTIVAHDGYDREAAAVAYARWFHAWTGEEAGSRCAEPWCQPFDVGITTSRALSAITPAAVREGRAARTAEGAADLTSQSNGALMRCSPLGVWGAGHREGLAQAARQDAAITHPNPICQDASVVFVIAIELAILGLEPPRLYRHVLGAARKTGLRPAVIGALEAAEDRPPSDYLHHQGWVLIALQNAFFQLLHAPNFEEGVVATVRAGGDTDTNAAICGALLGAVYGREAVPRQWQQMVLTCRPMPGLTRGGQPRPAMFWPVDVLTLADRLLTLSQAVPPGFRVSPGFRG